MEHSILFICKEVSGEDVSEIQVIPFGRHETNKGTFVHDDESQKLVMQNFAELKRDTVIDYEHQTLSGAEAPAAGWIKSGKLINKGKDGTWAQVDWTNKGKEYIQNKEYKYVSPVFWVRDSDRRVVKLINVALTNQPNIDGMTPLINKLTFSDEERIKMKELMRLLGLGEDSTEEQAIEKLKALLQSIESNKNEQAVVANKVVCESLGLKEKASESEVKATIMAMKQGSKQTDSLTQKVEELNKKLAKLESDDVVQMAMKEGKITPDQKAWAEKYAVSDLEGFKLFVEKAPIVVPMGNVSGENKKTTDKKSLDDAQIQVNKMLGVSDESFKKFSNVK